MVLVKKWQFFCLFIVDNMGQENVFENIISFAAVLWVATKRSSSRALRDNT